MKKRMCKYESNYTKHEEGEKVRIVFIYQVASFWPSWDSVLKICLKDRRFDAKVLLLREHGIEKAQMVSAEDFIKKSGIPYLDFDTFDLDEFKPHYAMFQTPYELSHRGGNIKSWTAYLKRRGIRIVYIPYGIEIADTESAHFAHFGSQVIMNAFRIYTLSEEMKKEYMIHCCNNKNVRAFGLPKFDGLIDKKRFALSEELKRKINGRKILLWKTHFPKTIIENGMEYQVSPSLEEYIKFAQYVESYESIFFIFCPHPKFCDSGNKGIQAKAKELIKLLERKNNLLIDYADDYRYSLVNSDAIIVDRSSIMVEAAATSVPVMYMFNKDYDEPLTPPIRMLVDSYYKGTTCDDMRSFIDMILDDRDYMKKVRTETTEFVIPYMDGKCGERIANDLYESVDEEGEELYSYCLSGKKILIWGTGHIANTMYYMLLMAEKRRDISVVCYVDSDKKKQGVIFQNKAVISPEEIVNQLFDYVVISSEIHYNSILNKLLELGVATEKIINFDRFIVELLEV